jgi:hypothetical protein
MSEKGKVDALKPLFFTFCLEYINRELEENTRRSGTQCYTPVSGLLCASKGNYMGIKAGELIIYSLKRSKKWQ